MEVLWKAIDVAVLLEVHQRVGDFVLHVAWRNARHAFAHGFFAQLFDVVFGDAGQRAAIVQLELLQQRQVGLLRLFQPGQLT